MPILVHPVPGAPISVAIDASDKHIGGVLQQRVQQSWSRLAFHSRKLFDTETRYSAFDHELLAVLSAIYVFSSKVEISFYLLITNL